MILYDYYTLIQTVLFFFVVANVIVEVLLVMYRDLAVVVVQLGGNWNTSYVQYFSMTMKSSMLYDVLCTVFVVLKALQASSEDQDDVVHTGTEVMHEQLWVDKYAPNSFTELLSDEQTNREVCMLSFQKTIFSE